MKSVKSFNPCQSVIQTIYEIVKSHGGELKVKTEEGEARLSRYFSGDSVGQGTEFIIQLPIYQT